MNKEIRVLSAIAIVFFLLCWGCASKKAPGEPQVTVPTNTPTSNLTPIDVSAQVTKTCFVADTCSAGSSATLWAAEDADSYIWATEMSGCANFVKYDAGGNSAFSTTAPQVTGMTTNRNINWLWYSQESFAGEEQYFFATESNNFGTGGANFTLSKEINEHFYGLGCEEQYLWTIKKDGTSTLPNWYCCKFSASGQLVMEFSVTSVTGSEFYGITVGDGYLWLSSCDIINEVTYLYKMLPSGYIETIFYFDFKFFGIDWVSTNTFHAALLSEVCKINF